MHSKRSQATVATITFALLSFFSLTLAAVEPSLMDQGEDIFLESCSTCHGRGGEGIAQAFPALAGNENIADVGLVVANIHSGKGAMPAFPQLDTGQLQAVATYVRNAWGNDFGAVSEDDVEEALSAAQGSALSDSDANSSLDSEARSTWFTSEQAQRGYNHVMVHCEGCHGGDLYGGFQGGPPLAGSYFMNQWGGRSAASLFTYMQNAMPPGNPGVLNSGEYVEILAYVLQVNGYVAGETPLQRSDLEQLDISPQD